MQSNAQKLPQGLSKKIAVTLGLAVVFGWWLFPLRDLAEQVAAKVSQTSGIYIQFDDFEIDLIPPRMGIQSLVLEAGAMPAMKVERARISPWILGFLSGRIGASLDLEGFFDGLLVADYREGQKIESKTESQNSESDSSPAPRALREILIGADASGINLESLSKYLKQANILSMSMRGSMNLSANEFVIDPSFKKQPNGNLNLAVSTFLLPSFRFSALGIPIAIPEMRLGQMKMDARMKDGQLEIQGLSIGAKGSPLTGTAKGRVDISFARSAADSMASRGQIQTLINGADLYFDLSVSRELMADPTMSVALNTLLSACRQDSATGTRFNCHMIYDPLKSSQPAFLRAQ